MHLLARFRRARSFGRPPYEALNRQTLMKAGFQRAAAAMHLLARFRRARSFGRPPYESLDRKTLMKINFQRAAVAMHLLSAPAAH
jgi:hypothetical protein